MAGKNRGKPRNVSAKELAEFDREFVIDTFRPLSKANRLRWERMRRGETVDVPIDARLLKKVDTLAKKNRISRKGLIERGIKAMLEPLENSE
jgi:hypothetical protein